MINSQQYISLFLMIKVLTLLGLIVMVGVNTGQTAIIDNMNYIFESKTPYTEAIDDTTYQQSDNQYERSVGNAFQMSKISAGMILTLIFPSFKASEYAVTDFQKTLAYALMVFEALLYVYGFLWLYDKFKNKKVD